MDAIEISDEQIFKSLLAKRDKLFNELKRVNMAIEVYQPPANAGLSERKSFGVTVNDLNHDIDVDLNNGNYNENFKAVHQLHFALKHFGSATIPIVTKYIYEFDKRWDVKKLNKRLTDIASLEFRSGRINGYKSNGRYIYSLKEQK